MSTAKFENWVNPDGTTNYKCRAWVNFDGTGTVAIRASGNVSSITDNGTGDYTVNFTTAMVDADYSVAGSAMRNASSAGASAGPFLTPFGSATYSDAFTTSSVRLLVKLDNQTATDPLAVNVTIFR